MIKKGDKVISIVDKRGLIKGKEYVVEVVFGNETDQRLLVTTNTFSGWYPHIYFMPYNECLSLEGEKAD